ncbi:MAG: hypothetical protein J3R72DRAFT_447125 [Linnemannia gamsii]|nr:MAG: hypothetical protein J3R72DRAFT_447125 [Linnemannia gamsii]
MRKDAKPEEPKNPGKKLTPRKKRSTVRDLAVKQYQPTMHSYIVPNSDSMDNNETDDNPSNDNEASTTYKRAIDGLLNWLETDDNYHTVYSQAKTTVGTKTETAANAWIRAATFVTAHVNKTGSTTESQVKYSGPAMRERANRYKSKYFAIARAAMGTGAGVSEESGADNISQQQEQVFRHYSRMEKLFGNNPHLVPAYRVSTGRSKGQSIIKFSSRAKNVDVQQALDGASVDQGTTEGETDADSWTRRGTYDRHPEDEESEVDQDYFQEHQGVSEKYGDTFGQYRSNQGSTITSNSESKKRTHAIAKGSSETTSNSGTRRVGPLNLFSHQSPAGKNKSITNDKINELLDIKLRKSKDKEDNPNPKTTAQHQHEREMALIQQKHRLELELMQKAMEQNMIKLKGEAMLHGIVTGMSQEKLDEIEVRFNRMIGSTTSTASAVNADKSRNHSDQVAKDPILHTPENSILQPTENSVPRVVRDNSAPLADDLSPLTENSILRAAKDIGPQDVEDI